jgi:hypothetical protein
VGCGKKSRKRLPFNHPGGNSAIYSLRVAYKVTLEANQQQINSLDVIPKIGSILL